MPMMSIVIPGNAQTFNSMVFPIVMFDVMDQIDFDASVLFKFDEQGQEKLQNKMLD